jgi:hypothetical protein
VSKEVKRLGETAGMGSGQIGVGVYAKHHILCPVSAASISVDRQVPPRQPRVVSACSLARAQMVGKTRESTVRP